MNSTWSLLAARAGPRAVAWCFLAVTRRSGSRISHRLLLPSSFEAQSHKECADILELKKSRADKNGWSQRDPCGGRGSQRVSAGYLQLVTPFVGAPEGAFRCVFCCTAGGGCYVASILLSHPGSFSSTKVWASALRLGRCVYLVITINNLVKMRLLFPTFKWLSILVLLVFS